MLEGEALKDVDGFTYRSSIIDKQGGTDPDIKIRIDKAKAAFHQLKNVWGSTNPTTNIKIGIYNTTVKPVLLYGELM